MKKALNLCQLPQQKKIKCILWHVQKKTQPFPYSTHLPMRNACLALFTCYNIVSRDQWLIHSLP